MFNVIITCAATESQVILPVSGYEAAWEVFHSACDAAELAGAKVVLEDARTGECIADLFDRSHEEEEWEED